MTVRILLGLSLLSTGCHQRRAAVAAAEAVPIEAVVGEAYGLANEGRCSEVAPLTAPAVRQLEAMQETQHVQAVRVPEMTLSALVGSSMEAEGMGGVVVSSLWADMFYLRAYCAIEAGEPKRAMVELAAGLAVLPGDVLLLVEMGHAQQMLGEHHAAIRSFEAALVDVERLSEMRTVQETPGWSINGRGMQWWHGRCLRGVGYSQIELGDLDAAEQTYLTALTVNINDHQAHKELNFISMLRAESEAQ